MTRDEYNEFVQKVQREADAFHLEHRIHAQRATGQHPNFPEGQLMMAELQVFWDDWQTVAYERFPMSPNTTRHTDEDRWAKITYDAAGALSR
jgi:hypothetical protein